MLRNSCPHIHRLKIIQRGPQFNKISKNRKFKWLKMLRWNISLQVPKLKLHETSAMEIHKSILRVSSKISLLVTCKSIEQARTYWNRFLLSSRCPGLSETFLWESKECKFVTWPLTQKVIIKIQEVDNILQLHKA